MKEPFIDEALDRECSVFCRYLIGQEPNEYVKRKYRDAHRSLSWARVDQANPSDIFLLHVARIRPWSSKVIDAYARVFRPASLVRKKLILLLAILESCAPSHLYLDAVDASSIPAFVLKSLPRCATFVLAFSLAVFLIFPLELAARGSAKLSVLWSPRHG